MDVKENQDHEQYQAAPKRKWLRFFVIVTLVVVGLAKLFSALVAYQTESYLNDLQGDFRFTNVKADSGIWNIDLTFDAHYVTQAGEKVEELDFDAEIELQTAWVILSTVAYFDKNRLQTEFKVLRGRGFLNAPEEEKYKVNLWLTSDGTLQVKIKRGRYFIADDSRSSVIGDEGVAVDLTIQPNKKIALSYYSENELAIGKEGLLRIKGFEYDYKTDGLSRLSIKGIEFEPGAELLATTQDTIGMEANISKAELLGNINIEGITLDDVYGTLALLEKLDLIADDNFQKKELEVEIQKHVRQLIKKEATFEGDLAFLLNEERVDYRFDLIFSAEDELTSYLQLAQWLKGNIYSSGNLAAIEGWKELNQLLAKQIEESSGVSVQYATALVSE
jgi:hypothetical protein